jgi:hypothetical protein
MYKEKEILEACNTAINNIIKEGTTDVELFKKPFEIKLLENNEIRREIIENVVKSIKKCNFEELKISKIGHVLVPKKNLCDYRKCAWIDVIDEIKYLTLVLLMAKDIEVARDNKSNKKVFSYRLKTKGNNGYIFDNEYNYTSFRNRIAEKSKMKNKRIVVECDISNFYDRLNLHRLESILLSIEKIDKDAIKLLNEILLFWSNRDSYGLPVGSNASRILAEAALIEIDNYLISKNIDFCRFVDDYRIFAKSASEAHKNLAILVERLNKEGLFLNFSKTNIKELIKNDDKQKQEKKENKNFNVEVFNKIIRGYSGLIPLKFRELSDSEKNKFTNEDENENILKLKDTLLIDPKEFIVTIKIIVAKEKYDRLSEISEIIDRFPQFIPYYVDILIKYASKIPRNTINKIKNNMSKWITEDEIPEYIKVYVIRLFSIDEFKDKEIVFRAFRNLKRNAGDYIGRAILESLENDLNRGEVIEIRDYYTRADIWEKREILKIVQKKLNVGENRPFFKDIKLHSQDILEKYLTYTEDKSQFRSISSVIKK